MPKSTQKKTRGKKTTNTRQVKTKQLKKSQVKSNTKVQPKEIMKKVDYPSDVDSEEIGYLRSGASVRAVISLLYDLQASRIQYNNRVKMIEQNKSSETNLEKEPLDNIFEGLEKFEKNLQSVLQDYVSDKPQMEYLSRIRGIGTILSANLIAIYGDMSKFDTISRLWSYSGFGIHDGVADRRKKGEKIHYNPFAKTLGWKLMQSWIKQSADKSFYRKYYDQVKAKYMEREGYFFNATASPKGADGKVIEVPEGKKPKGEWQIRDGWKPKEGQKEPMTKLHIERMTQRKVIKLFLSHLWISIRKIYKLPITDPYIMGKAEEGGHIHSHIIPPQYDK